MLWLVLQWPLLMKKTTPDIILPISLSRTLQVHGMNIPQNGNPRNQQLGTETINVHAKVSVGFTVDKYYSEYERQKWCSNTTK